MLYLMQHGDSKNKTEDPKRHLSNLGINDVNNNAKLLTENLTANISIIYHSGKERSEDTANILVKYLRPELGVKLSEGLKPMDEPNLWLEKANLITSPTIIVGHLPHLGRLANLLLNRDADAANIIAFQMASILCLDKDSENDNWYIKFFLPVIHKTKE